MSDAAGSHRETLEACLKELTRLRNQTGPTIAFKKWRQRAIEAIQGLWPDDRPKVSRFLRIPFLPSSAKADRTEVRRVYDRGCGEATSYLKNLVAEVNGRAPAEPAPAPEPAAPPAAAGHSDHESLPDLSWFDADAPPVFTVRSAPSGRGGESVRPELPASTLSLMSMAVEIESLGVAEADRSRVREALLELARTLDTRQLTWRQLHSTVVVVMEYPAVARRVLPLIVPFLDRAA